MIIVQRFKDWTGLHRQAAVLDPDEKLNCFDFGQKKYIKKILITFIRDQSRHPRG